MREADKPEQNVKQKVSQLQTATGSQTQELSSLRSANDHLKDELSRCKIQLARYEERSKDEVGYNREIGDLKKDAEKKEKRSQELLMENDALKSEIER